MNWICSECKTPFIPLFDGKFPEPEDLCWDCFERLYPILARSEWTLAKCPGKGGSLRSWLYSTFPPTAGNDQTLVSMLPGLKEVKQWQTTFIG